MGEGWIRALSALSFRQGEVRGFPVKVEGGAGVGEGWMRALSALFCRQKGAGVGEE